MDGDQVGTMGAGGVLSDVEAFFGETLRICGEVERLAREKGSATAGIVLEAVGKACVAMGMGMGGRAVMIEAKPTMHQWTAAPEVIAGMSAPPSPRPPRGGKRGRARGARKGPRGRGGAKKVKPAADGSLPSFPQFVKGLEAMAEPVRGERGPRGAKIRRGAAGHPKVIRAAAVAGPVGRLEDATERKVVMALGGNGGRLHRDALLAAMDRTNYPGQAVEELKSKGWVSVASDGPGKVWFSLTLAGNVKYLEQKAADEAAR